MANLEKKKFKRRKAHSAISGMNHFFYDWLLCAAPLFQKLPSLPNIRINIGTLFVKPLLWVSSKC
ncbi:hypothetical protein T06_767 [Trichinella sp. T6]|nr:hypothetical protein T06_767 [Trichinella sp. T6]